MFYEQLKKLCEERGTTITAVTTTLGLSKGGLSRWRNGGNPTADVVRRFADYFGVTADYLLAENQDDVAQIDRLIETYFRGIKIWNDNQFLSTKERSRVKAHFAELLLRYKKFVNAYCDEKVQSNDSVNVDTIHLNKFVESLIMWVSLLPEYLANVESQSVLEASPSNSLTQYGVPDENNLLEKLRALPPEKRKAIEALIE